MTRMKFTFYTASAIFDRQRKVRLGVSPFCHQVTNGGVVQHTAVRNETWKYQKQQQLQGSTSATRVDAAKRKGRTTSAMTIHNLYIFSKTGTLLYYTEWNRLNKSGITKEEEAKLMYGMLFSIKSFVSKISPLDPKEGFLYYKTNKYTLHYFETPSGLKFVLNTDNASQSARELLQQLYREVYLEYVVKNPLCQLNEPIQSELFKLKVDELFKKSPLFLSRSL